MNGFAKNLGISNKDIEARTDLISSVLMTTVIHLRKYGLRESGRSCNFKSLSVTLSAILTYYIFKPNKNIRFGYKELNI